MSNHEAWFEAANFGDIDALEDKGYDYTYYFAFYGSMTKELANLYQSMPELPLPSGYTYLKNIIKIKG